jgi:putative endonuclease
MFYVYIIKSKKIDYLYLGCSQDLKKRLAEHNDNKVKSTKNKGPFEIRYYESFYSKEDAFNREQKLKKNYRGLQELKKRIKNSLK